MPSIASRITRASSKMLGSNSSDSSCTEVGRSTVRVSHPRPASSVSRSCQHHEPCQAPCTKSTVGWANETDIKDLTKEGKHIFTKRDRHLHVHGGRGLVVEH